MQGLKKNRLANDLGFIKKAGENQTALSGFLRFVCGKRVTESL